MRRCQRFLRLVPLPRFPVPPAVQEFDDFEDEDFQEEADPEQGKYWRSDWDTDDVDDEFSKQLKEELQRNLQAAAPQ